jgi:hypothetical protein
MTTPTLNSIAHLIKDRLAGGNSSTDNQLDERDLALRIRQALNSVLRISTFENQQQGDRNSANMYVATYEVAIETDKIEKYKYIELPDVLANLAHNKGIHSMHPKGSPDERLLRSNNHYVTSHLRVGHMEGDPSYFLEGNRLVMRKKNFKTAWKDMIVKLKIAAPDKFGLNDPLPVYADQVFQVVDLVTQYYAPPVIQDVLNDGNKDIGVNING